MSTYISVEISGDTVVQEMLDNGKFAVEVWRSMFEGLTAGRLFDDCVDLMTGLDTGEREDAVFVLRRLADAIEQRARA